MDSYVLTLDSGIGSIFFSLLSSGLVIVYILILILVLVTIFFALRFFYFGAKLFKKILEEKELKNKEDDFNM